MPKLTRIAAAMLLAAAMAGPAPAAEGDLTVTDGRQTVTLDRDDLDGLRQDVIETTTPVDAGQDQGLRPILYRAAAGGRSRR